MVRRVLIAVAAATALVPASAHAAEVRVGQVALSGYSQHPVWTSAIVEDGVGERNQVSAWISRGGVAKVLDIAARPTLGASRFGVGTCWLSMNANLGNEVTCAGVCVEDPTGITNCQSELLSGFVADLGAGDDSVTVSGFDATSLDGGAGRDSLSGGASDDWIYAGDDGGTADRIRCGGGYDVVSMDAADVIVDGACEDVYSTG